MPINKNQLLRLRILDECFRKTQQIFYAETLLDELDKQLKEYPMYNNPPSKEGGKHIISRQTLYSDIKLMRDTYLAPIKQERIQIEGDIKSKTVERYFYADHDYSINMQLDEEDMRQIKSIFDTLKRFRGLPQLAMIQDSWSKLLQDCSSGESCVSFEENPSHSELNMKHDHVMKDFNTIFQAIQDKCSLTIVYRSFGIETPKTFIFHPQYIKQYNKRWYSFGTSDLPEVHGGVHVLPIDERIESIERSKEPYSPLPGIDWTEYFNHFVGVTDVNSEPQKIVLHIHGKIRHYIKDNPVHGQQKSKMVTLSENGEEVLEVILPEMKINFELLNWLKRHAEAIEVRQPKELRDLFVEELQKGINLNCKQN